MSNLRGHEWGLFGTAGFPSHGDTFTPAVAAMLLFQRVSTDTTATMGIEGYGREVSSSAPASLTASGAAE